MPYHWTENPQTLTLWPHQSLTAKGFVVFVSATVAMVSLPLLAVLGSPALWGLLPFIAAAVAALWFAIDRNRRDADLTETCTLLGDRIALVRREPRGRVLTWNANPYWVSVHLHNGSKPVENYLTLKGGGREVEIGAFLSPEERKSLHQDLEQALARLRSG